MRGPNPSRTPSLHARIRLILVGLLTANILAWLWAGLAFHANALLLGTAFLAYGLGLRHAVDADHIAAIDNATRRLMQSGQRPTAIGLFFSLGHSTIVVLASAAIAGTALAFRDQFAALQAWGSIVGTAVSAAFLLIIAAVNAAILPPIWRALRSLRHGGTLPHQDIHALLGKGVLARLLRPAFGLIRTSWHMYPLGVLFGLGFDTATEIGLLGISATQAAHGMPIWTIMVFPALFTAGMSLIDTLDGMMMLGAYGHAAAYPARRLRYNFITTALSVAVALAIGGIEALGIIGDRFSLSGDFWVLIAACNDRLGAIGFIIIAAFALIWGGSVIVQRWRGELPAPR